MTPHYEKRPQSELAHLAWCLMVAVKIAKQDGIATTKANEHMFIMRWLSNAQKRKLFPKSVAPDILWLQAQGKKHSITANLLGKAEYIWKSATGSLKEQNDLFRLTYFIEVLKDKGWEDVRMSPAEWEADNYSYTSTSQVYIRMVDVARCFDENNMLSSPMELRFTGSAEDVFQALTECEMFNSKAHKTPSYFCVTLIPIGEMLAQ